MTMDTSKSKYSAASESRETTTNSGSTNKPDSDLRPECAGYATKPSWDLAPDWATALFKHREKNRYVFSDGKQATPSICGQKPFSIILAMWNLVEERPPVETKQPVYLGPVLLPPENSGGSCNYYKVEIVKPTTAESAYTAECNDVIEALNMTYAEANMFKEIWRTAAARTLGKVKVGHDGRRGAEKIIFFAKRHGIAHDIIG